MYLSLSLSLPSSVSLSLRLSLPEGAARILSSPRRHTFEHNNELFINKHTYKIKNILIFVGTNTLEYSQIMLAMIHEILEYYGYYHDIYSTIYRIKPNKNLNSLYFFPCRFPCRDISFLTEGVT